MTMPVKLIPVAVLAVLLVGCGTDAHAPRRPAPPPARAVVTHEATTPPTAPPSAAPTPVPPAPVSPATIATAGATTCRVGEPVELDTVDRPRTHVAVSFRGSHGLAAWATAENSLSIRPLDTEGHPTAETRTTEFRKAGSIALLAPLPNGTIALSAGQLCNRAAFACFQAIGIGDDGNSLGTAYLPEPADQMASVTGYAIAGSNLFATHARRYGYDLVRYQIADNGEVTGEALPNLHLDGGGAGEVPLRAVAASSDGRAFVLAEYEGETGGRVARLYDSGEARLLPSMRGFGQNPEGIDVDLMEVDGDAVVIVTARKYFRVGFDGHVLVGPVRIADRSALPESLRDRVISTIEGQRGHAVLVRRDLAHQDVGEPTVLASSMATGSAIAQLAWLGDRFVVVAAEPTASGVRITSRTVTCAP